MSLAAGSDGRELETEWVLRQFNNDGCPALRVSMIPYSADLLSMVFKLKEFCIVRNFTGILAEFWRNFGGNFLWNSIFRGFGTLLDGMRYSQGFRLTEFRIGEISCSSGISSAKFEIPSVWYFYGFLLELLRNSAGISGIYIYFVILNKNVLVLLLA